MFRHADDVSCVHPVTVLNATFCITCSLLMLVEDVRATDHMEEAYRHIAPIAQLVSALDLVTSSEQVEGSILTAGKKLSEKSECNNSGYKLTGLTWWP